MRIRRFWGLGLLALVIALVAVACGGDDNTPAPASTPTPVPVATTAPAATAAPETPTTSTTPTAPTAAPTATPTLAPGVTPPPRPTATPVPPPPGFDAEEYFGGKTIRIITGTSPGGGYDVFSRLVAATAERYFPESTRFIVQNLPGAGQYRGLKAVLDAKPDGLTVGPVHSRWFQRQALVNDIPNFDLDKIYILGSPTFAIGKSVFCVDRSVATSWEEVLALGRPLIQGATAPGNEPATEFMQANGGPFRIVYGYGGTSDIMAAFDRGELDLTSRCGPATAPRLFPEWIEDGRLVPLFYEKKPVDDEYLALLGHTGPLPSFKDLPGLDINPTQLAALEVNLLVTELSRVFIMQENVPADIAQYWQSQFDQMMVDPEFIDGLTIAGYADSYGYGRAEDLLEVVRVARELDPATRDIVLELSGVGDLQVN